MDGGLGGFSLDLVFTSYSRRDQLIICRGTCPAGPPFAGTAICGDCDEVVAGVVQGNCDNCVFYDSGCVGVTNQHSYTTFPTQTAALNVHVKVHPNCQGGRGTAWNMQSTCTAAPPPPAPTPVFSPSPPVCETSTSQDVASVDATANTITLAIANSAIQAGDIVRLTDKGAVTCLAAAAGDLVVASVSVAVITLTTGITNGIDAATNCELVRKVPLCSTGRTAPIIRDGADTIGAGTPTQVCYHNHLDDLAVEAKVFGQYKVPNLPGYKNYTNLVLSIGTTVQPAAAWHLADPQHGDGTGMVVFDALQAGLTTLFSDGANQISLTWDQSKLGGCVTLPPTTCEGHNWLLYILFLVILVLICAGTYKSVVRKHAVKPPPSHIVHVKDYNGETHELEINDTMSISDLKSLLEKVSGVDITEMRLFNESYSTNQLEGPLLCTDCGLISTGDQGKDDAESRSIPVLTMMVCWTLYIREDSVSESVAEKMRELGMDLAAKIHTLEGVEKHWKIDSLKLRVEQMTGVPPRDQSIYVVTAEEKIMLEDGTKLPEYAAHVKNRTELVMVDGDPQVNFQWKNPDFVSRNPDCC